MSDKTRTRRDHEKYLTLIDTIALLHQHQRPVKSTTHQGRAVEYIEVTLDDIARANALAHDVLGRSLDELPPQTRRLLSEVVSLVRAQAQALGARVGDVRFTRKLVRDHVGWTDFQVKTHMHKLEELEYVLVHRGGRGQSFEYELLYDGEGQDGKPFVMGLIDVETLSYDGSKEHAKPKKEHPSSPQIAPKEHPSSIEPSAQTPALARLSGHSSSIDPKKHFSKANGKTSSYPHAAPAFPLAAAAAD